MNNFVKFSIILFSFFTSGFAFAENEPTTIMQIDIKNKTNEAMIVKIPKNLITADQATNPIPATLLDGYGCNNDKVICYELPAKTKTSTVTKTFNLFFDANTPNKANALIDVFTENFIPGSAVDDYRAYPKFEASFEVQGNYDYIYKGMDKGLFAYLLSDHQIGENYISSVTSYESGNHEIGSLPHRHYGITIKPVPQQSQPNQNNP